MNKLKKFNFLLFGKRKKIIFTSVVLSLALLASQWVPFYLTQNFIIGLAFVTYILSLASLWEGIDKLKAVILFILPTFFTVAVAGFFFLLPLQIFIRLPVAAAFGLIFYTLLLSQNVFNVASLRTIPLYRVASITVFILTLFTAFLLLFVLFSLNLLFIWNTLGAFIICFPLILHVFWSIDMEDVSWLSIVYSLVISLALSEIALALSFWPISKSLAALVLATFMFVFLGISTQALRDRLSRGVVWEYIAWGIFMLTFASITTSWRG